MRKLPLQAYLGAFAVLIFSTAAAAYAQIPGMEEVSGTYSTPDAGVTITFPDGWSGAAFGAEGMTIATVSPGEMGAEVEKAIMLIVADKTEVEGDPTDPSSYQEDAPDCTVPTPTETTLSGKRGFELIMECTDDEGNTNKMKMTIGETSDTWIAVMYMSPVDEFDADVGDYDTAVVSLQIQGAVDATVPSMPSDDGDGTGDDEMESTDMPVMVGEESINVEVQSASTISAFGLDEATKTVSFTADGSGDMTVVSVGSVLEGPYTVMVDGVAVTDFESTTDESGVSAVSVPHASGSHEITITGTQVVPEFPVAMLVVLAGVIAAATFAGRTKFKGRI